MKIKKIIIRIQLYGIPITYIYLAKVFNDIDFIIIPIGRRIIYYTDHNSPRIIYCNLPKIQMHNLQVRVLDINLFKNLMFKIFEDLYSIKTVPSYLLNRSDGIQIQYVDIEPIINFNSRIHTLVHGRTPSQDQIRGILDVMDQLQGYIPSGYTLITVYISSKIDPLNIFYITQIPTKSQYIYDEKYLYFISENLGKIKYNLLTGNISSELNSFAKINLANQFKMNYPNVNYSNILFNVIVVQPDVSMATITYTNKF